GEQGIYVSLAETEEELRDGALSHGWTIPEQIKIFELVPPESVIDSDQHQSLLYSSDLELGETTKRIFDEIERVKPKRVVIDSLSEFRLLAQSSLRYRRQILALKHYFAQRHSPRPTGSDLRRPAAAPPRRQMPRTVFPWRSPRFHDRGEGSSGLPAL